MSKMKEHDYDVRQLLLDLHQTKVKRDEVEAAYKAASKAYLAALSDNEMDSMTTEWRDLRITGTKVQASTVKVDEEALAEAVGSQKWVTISKRVLDMKLLEDAVVRDRVSPTLLAQHSTEVPRAPYTKVTVKAVTKEDE